MVILRWFKYNFSFSFLKAIIQSHAKLIIYKVKKSTSSFPALSSPLNCRFLHLHAYLTLILGYLITSLTYYVQTEPLNSLPSGTRTGSSPSFQFCWLTPTHQFLRPKPRDLHGFHQFPYPPHICPVNETSYLSLENIFQIWFALNKPKPFLSITHPQLLKLCNTFLTSFSPSFAPYNPLSTQLSCGCFSWQK